MNRQSERFLKKNINKTLNSNSSLNKKGSRSWYSEDLYRCLHKSLRHYNDVKNFCNINHDEKIYGVYLRHEIGQAKRVKIGKGVVYYNNGRAVCTRDHMSSTENPLETEVFIPCISEESALALEEALHRYYGKTEGVHRSIEKAYEIVDPRWLQPSVNSDGSKGGTENFDFQDIWNDRIVEFENAVKEVCRQENVNVRDFSKIARENSQVKGSDLLCRWLLNGNDMKDFYLLMKPRSGKNTTVYLGIAKYINALKETNQNNKKIIIDFISLWPSAFEGAKNDLADYYYMENVVIAGIDTGEESWKERLSHLLVDNSVDVIIRFASMQSIDMSVAKNYNTDEDREGPQIIYESDKCDYLKNNPADLCVIDESDHGMRTERSQEALRLFGYNKCIWMSGTDLYALRHEIRIGNHFLYDIFDEVQDVLAGNINMPRMRKHTLIPTILPLEELDESSMDEKGITRKINNVFETTKNGEWKYDKFQDRFVDKNRDIITFKKIGEVKRFWELMYFWDNDKGHKSPEDHNNIFCCMPSVASCLAMYNHIKDHSIECSHAPLTANTFSSANRIEKQVNDEMGVSKEYPSGSKRTIFFTVGRMLRGAKAPWSAVIRFDSYCDFKIGLQLELRGQNTTEDWFDVYDANMFRSSKMQYDLVRSRTSGGNVAGTGKKLHNLIPMYRKGEFEVETTTWDDIQQDYLAGNVVEGMKRRDVFDKNGLIAAKDMLSSVSKSKTEIKTEKDKREGKVGKSTRQTSSTGEKQKDELEELFKKAMTISSMLPMLMDLTDYKHTQIDELFNAVPDSVFLSWAGDKCNITLGHESIELLKNNISSIFDKERINEQLIIVKNKTDNGKELDYSSFNVSADGDVNTPLELAREIVEKIAMDNCNTVLDISVGDGSLIHAAVEKLAKYKNKDDLSRNVYIADNKIINLKFTAKRLYRDFGIVLPDSNIIHYDTVEDFYEQVKNMKIEFDVIVGNPPYTSGSKLLYTKFFAKAIELADLVEFVMPVQLDSLHDKLKHHNHLLKKHLVKLGDNVSNQFNVGYNTIHHVTASKNVINTVQKPDDPIDSLDLLYPDRKRLNFTKGDTDTGQTTDPNGVTAIDKIHKGDTVIWRKIPQAVYDKSNKKSNAPYLVCVNHTPSRGKFNCAIVSNTSPSYTWAIWTFVLEAKTLENATKLQSWLKSDEITNEVNRMFAQRGNDFYTVSKKILDRLPYYE